MTKRIAITGHEAELNALEAAANEPLPDTLVAAAGKIWSRADLERYAKMDRAELVAALTAEDMRPSVLGEETPRETIEREADEVERALVELGYR